MPRQDTVDEQIARICGVVLFLYEWKIIPYAKVAVENRCHYPDAKLCVSEVRVHPPSCSTENGLPRGRIDLVSPIVELTT